jgi:hypothetical protein
MHPSAISLLAFLALTSAKDASELFRVLLRSKHSPKVHPVPPRYLAPDHHCPEIPLIDSGILETEINVGSPPQTVKVIIDTVEKRCTLPILLSEISSDSLAFTSSGNWRDTFSIGSLKVDQEFQFVEQSPRLGLNVDNTNSPFFDKLVMGRLLGMDLFSFLLTRQSEQLIGELLFGDVENSPTKAILRHSPIAIDELGWSLNVVDVRIDREYCGYVGRVVIDTSTPFTILPRRIFTNLVNRLGLDVVLDGDILLALPDSCEKLKSLPTLYFSIETDEFIWDAEHYVIPTEDGKCLLAMAGYDAKVNDEEVWVFGTSFFIDRVAVFDYATKHIGLTDYQPDSAVDGQIEEQLFKSSDGYIVGEDLDASQFVAKTDL